MRFFLAPDRAAAQWAARHPHGFVVVVRSRPGGAAQCLHDACCADLFAAVPTPGLPRVRAWACAVERDELEAWADWEGYGLVYCQTCGAEANKFGPPLVRRSPAALRPPSLPPAPSGGRGVPAPIPALTGPIPSEGNTRADS